MLKKPIFWVVVVAIIILVIYMTNQKKKKAAKTAANSGNGNNTVAPVEPTVGTATPDQIDALTQNPEAKQSESNAYFASMNSPVDV